LKSSNPKMLGHAVTGRGVFSNNVHKYNTHKLHETIKRRPMIPESSMVSAQGLSLMDWLAAAKDSPGMFDPGMFQIGLTALPSVMTSTVSRSIMFNTCSNKHAMVPFGTETYTIFSLAPALTNFDFSDSNVKMSGWSML
jgi:hypothetical protein